MRKKTLSIVAALFMCACGAWAAVTPDTAFKLANPANIGEDRGYLVGYDASASGLTLVEMGATLQGYYLNGWPTTLNDESVHAYWAVYKSEKNNTYLYNITDGKFLNASNVALNQANQAKGATLTENAMPVVFEEFDEYVRIKTVALETRNYLNFAPGYGEKQQYYAVFNSSNDKAINIVTEYAEGVEIDADILSLVKSKVAEYENPEKKFDANNAYTIYSQKEERGYLASWTSQTTNVSLAGVEYTKYKNDHPALDAEGVGIKWEIAEETIGKVTLKNLANGKYLTNVNNLANWSDEPMLFTYTFEADGTVHFADANNKFISAACGYSEQKGSVRFLDHEPEACDFEVAVVQPDPTTPGGDADLEAAKAEYTAASAAIGEFMTAYGANANEDIQAVLEAFNEALSAIHLSENPTVDEYKAATATINDAINKAQTEVDEILGNVDSDLLAAQKALDDYMQNVVVPLMDEIHELDENSDEYKALEAEIAALSEAFGDYLSTPNPTDVEGCTALLESVKVLVKNYEEVKSQLEPDAETDLDKAKAAYDAYLEDVVMPLMREYVNLDKEVMSNEEFYAAYTKLFEVANSYDLGSTTYETAEEYASALENVKTLVKDYNSTLEEALNPAAPVFPAAGDYYVYIKNYDTDRNPYLYNNVDEATGYTLQAADLGNANNGYIWHVTSDGEGKITNIVSGTGKGVGVNGGSYPVLSELDYEDAGEGYYYIGNSTIDDGWKWLNASGGGQNNGKGTRTVTNYIKENASKWTFETVNMENLTAYNVVVEGNEEGCAILGNNYAGNNGFFLASDVANVTAKEIEHYTTDITTEGNTVKVVYTATAEPIKVTYKVYVDNDIVSGFEKMEYAGDAPSFSAADVPSYVTAQIPEVIPADGNVEIHSSYNETLPFTVGGNVTFTLWNKPVSFDGTNFVDSVAEPTEDASTFTVGGDWFNGFTLFNKQANGYLTYGTVVSPGDNTKSTATQSADEPGAHLDLVAHNGAFFFRIHGTENNSYMNDRDGYVSTWNSAASLSADGSKVVFTEVEDIPEVDELAEALDFLYESAEATLNYIRTNYGAAVVGLKAEDAIEELNALIVGLRAFNKPTTMEEIEEAFDAVSDAALKFYDSCTITVLSRVISEAKEGEETEPTTLEKVKEIEDAILAKYGISALSNKK